MQFFHCYLVGPLNLQHGKIFITSYSVQNWPTKMVTSNEKKKKVNGRFSVTWPAPMQIYWNKRKCLHKKIIPGFIQNIVTIFQGLFKDHIRFLRTTY